jgi:hypothetical protein
MSKQITMKQARREFANRVTTSPARYEDGQKVAPRARQRRPLGATFRAWARKQYSGKPLSTKLAAIVGA